MYKSSFENITVALVGDVMLSKRLPVSPSSGLTQVHDILHAYECRIGNLETTVHYKDEGFPEAFPGGSYAVAEPASLNDLKWLGLNMFGTANNHSMDYGHDGLLATIKYLRKADLPFAGTGKDLADAARATYYDCKNGRVALIGITSSFHDSYLAGPQNQDLRGRPGVNPLRHTETYELDDDDYNSLSNIVEKTGVGNYHAQAVKEGYIVQQSKLKIGYYQFQKGRTGVVHTAPHEGDLQRTLDGVRNAACFADLVIVSIHSHQFKDNDKTKTPQFVSTFAHECIDTIGGGVVFCHGPHQLRGIEVYNNGIIFYGLGNFILQHDQMNVLPEEQYVKYKTNRAKCFGEGELYDIQTNGNTRGLNTVKETQRSIIAGIEYSSSHFRVKLYPVQLDRYGVCSSTNDVSILEDVAKMSAEYGTNIKIDEQNAVALIDVV